jgi:lysozyme
MADDYAGYSGLDPSLVSAVQGFEGFAPKASWDYRQYSNGYGTRASAPGEVIDQSTANQRLMGELGKAQGQVDALGVQMPPGVRNALTSLTFNAGPGWMGSSLGQAVKSGNWDAARSIFLTYNKAGGKELPGLTERRQAEAGWFGGMPSGSPAGSTGAPGGMVAQASPGGTSLPPDAGMAPGMAQGAPAMPPQSQPQDEGLTPAPPMAPPVNLARLRNAIAGRSSFADMPLPPSVAQRIASLMGRVEGSGWLDNDRSGEDLWWQERNTICFRVGCLALILK